MTSLYIHIPFCSKKCFYCSFIVAIGQEQKVDRYLRALENEMQHYQGVKVKTIYIGGGTPSVLTVDQLYRLTALIKKYFQVGENIEWTMEMNPDDVSEEKLKCIEELGINRLSLGIQTFDDDRLKELGRVHNSEQARIAYSLLQNSACQNTSVDLMFAFRKQTLSELREDLKQIVNLGSQHISIYCLNIEPNSKFYAQSMEQPVDTEQAQFYCEIISYLKAQGIDQYEVSNFARSGFQSEHNRNYWMGGDYIGLGVGAHSHIQGRRYSNTDDFLQYIEKAQNGQDFLKEDQILTPKDRMVEVILFGLRMNEGVILKDIENQFQERLSTEQQQRLEQFCMEGLLIKKGDRFQASDRGRLVLDEISTYLLP